MTGTCKLCRALVMSPPVLEVGPERAKVEFLAFGEAMRDHMHREHASYLAGYSGLVALLVVYLSSRFAEWPTAAPELETVQATIRGEIVQAIETADVVIQLKQPGQAA